MAKLTLTDITPSRLTSIAAINNAFTAIETAVENTLSRDGTTPNTMSANIDMNGHTLLNYVLQFRVFTDADIADATHPVNTAGKAIGVPVYSSTSFKLHIASGSAAGDQWYLPGGGVGITPV